VEHRLRSLEAIVNKNGKRIDELQKKKEELIALVEMLSDKGQIEELLGVMEVAKALNVPEHWVYRHAKELPFAIKLPGKLWRFSRKGLEKYLAGGVNEL
jgi:excisionase family DNA binding protein